MSCQLLRVAEGSGIANDAVVSNLYLSNHVTAARAIVNFEMNYISIIIII